MAAAFTKRRRLGVRRITLALLIVLTGSSCAAEGPVRRSNSDSPIVILISIDGFRADYLDRNPTPNLDRLAKQGLRAESLIPVFPTKTFPNHYSMVTGLYPEHHGIVDNRFHDPATAEDFKYNDREIANDSSWWEAEPIWITMRHQGLRSATCFWPGSDVEIRGERPDYWRPFDSRMSHRSRVDQILEWLDLPEHERPALLTLYFSAVDTAGHRGGPQSKELTGAVRRVDGAIGWLIAGLEERELFDRVNVIVVSDHGMSESSPERVILIDDYIDLDTVHVSAWDPVIALWPEEGREQELFEKLSGAHPHLSVYRKNQIPENLHYRDNRRIPPILGIADERWRIASRAYFARHRDRFEGGAHGYDNALPSMHGLFIAHGPAFREGVVVEPFRNLHVYVLLAEILGVEPLPNDASRQAVAHLLAMGLSAD